MGQVGQELYIEVCKLERIVSMGVPNTHTRVRESCPSCPKEGLKPSKQAICTQDKGTSCQNKSIDQVVQLNAVKIRIKKSQTRGRILWEQENSILLNLRPFDA